MTFDEIIGQSHIVRYFSNAIKKDEVSHAYIFSGPRGTGKTTTARVLAKVLNCENPKGYNPCNECENCVSINKNSFMDVIELDAASNRGIDEIRNIRESTNYRPAYGKYKVYIIDEFHMLTKEAFNALLKTLEEPPSHVIFVLATTNLEKVPDTIISRSQLLNFKNLTPKDILIGLKRIAKLENIEYEIKALETISKKAKGSMRDAISMFEQVEKFGESKITVEDVTDILGIFDESFITKFIDVVSSYNVDEFLHLSQELFNIGKDPEVLIEESLEYLFEHFQERKDPTKDIHLMKMFNDLSKQLKYSENKRIVFDVELMNYMNQNKKENNVEVKKVPYRSNKEEQKFDNPIISKVLDFFSAPREKKANLAIYFSLLASQIKLKENRVNFDFTQEHKLEYEILRKYIDELKVNISLLIDDAYEVTISFSGENPEIYKLYEESPKYKEKPLF